jgi:hypothetical protein
LSEYDSPSPSMDSVISCSYPLDGPPSTDSYPDSVCPSDIPPNVPSSQSDSPSDTVDNSKSILPSDTKSKSPVPIDSPLSLEDDSPVRTVYPCISDSEPSDGPFSGGGDSDSPLHCEFSVPGAKSESPSDSIYKSESVLPSDTEPESPVPVNSPFSSQDDSPSDTIDSYIPYSEPAD